MYLSGNKSAQNLHLKKRPSSLFLSSTVTPSSSPCKKTKTKETKVWAKTVFCLLTAKTNATFSAYTFNDLWDFLKKGFDKEGYSSNCFYQFKQAIFKEGQRFFQVNTAPNFRFVLLNNVQVQGIATPRFFLNHRKQQKRQLCKTRSLKILYNVKKKWICGNACTKGWHCTQKDKWSFIAYQQTGTISSLMQICCWIGLIIVPRSLGTMEWIRHNNKQLCQPPQRAALHHHLQETMTTSQLFHSTSTYAGE